MKCEQEIDCGLDVHLDGFIAKDINGMAYLWAYGWYVRITQFGYQDGERKFVDGPFNTHREALVAMKVYRESGIDWSAPLESIRRQFDEVGHEGFGRLIAERMR